MSQAEEISAAARTVQILGQVVRNFSGSLRGDQKVSLLTASFALTWRVLGVWWEDARATIERVGTIAKQKRAEGKESEAETIDTVIDLLEMLSHFMSIGIIKHTAIAVGTEKAEESIRATVRESQNSLSRVLELAISLEHYGTFPKSHIDHVLGEFRTNDTVTSIVRALVYIHLSMYRVSYRDRDWAISKLKIPKEAQAQLLRDDDKMLAQTQRERAKGKKEAGRE